MSNIDQCPSTKETTPIPESAPELHTLSGRKYWRSLDEYTQTGEFKEFVEREFPGGASVLEETSRRSFMKVMGASMALAGAATIPGCRRPDHKILPYAKEVPEHVIPGKPLFFATALALPGGGVEGLLVETHEGRPTKIEGNPLHPNNQGKSSAFAQSSVLDLYDPDRLKYPVYDNPARGKLAATWDDFDAWSNEHFTKFDQTRGQGLAFIIDKRTSVARDSVLALLQRRWPQATFTPWSPSEDRGHVEGSHFYLGGPHWTRYSLSKAQRIVSVGTGQCSDGPEALRLERELAATRKIHGSGEEMSRVYAVEEKPSSIGAIADHRFRVAPSQVHNFVLALTKAVIKKAGNRPALANAAEAFTGDVMGISAAEITAIAEDLWAHRGHSVILPSDNLSTEAWALCQVINETLGAQDEGIVEFFPMDQVSARDSDTSLKQLKQLIDRGTIDTLVCLNTNPYYDAPGASGFREAFDAVPNTITLSCGSSETAAASTWSLNGTHSLEAWDAISGIDGQISIQQPMIAPLYDPARSDIELMFSIVGAGLQDAPAGDGYSIVRRALQDITGTSGTGFDKAWRAGLHNGVMGEARVSPVTTNPRTQMVMDTLVRTYARNGAKDAPGKESLDVVFYTDHRNDGSKANNGWMQELPEFGSSVVWDNPLLLSPKTAKALGILPEHTAQDEFNPYTKQQMPQAQLVTIKLGGREMTMAAWILPGMADNTVAIKLGYGRTNAGLVGNNVGFNTYDIKPESLMFARGATIEKASGTYTIASTQNHWSLESRTTIVRAIDKPWFDEHAKHDPKDVKDKIYGHYSQSLNVAEQMGELSHTPPNVGSYESPYSESLTDPKPGSAYSTGPQWGMSIDLNSCTGCSACTVACQSENNIPVVGKSEVAKGREMAWIRVDRYFVGDDLNNPDELYAQPVACVHCENAPCETVCPVNATVHGPEGTNDIAYNRCIGTRYCANNCPYKVRRFNFFDFGPAKFNGGLNPNYVTKEGEELFDEHIAPDRTFNQNLIPPRLRKKLDEISKMKFNPHVTVRSRGVIEKCTYCIQRVNEARQDAKIQGLWTEKGQTAPIPDGFFQVACQQACPTDAIAFGDILDPGSRVSHERESHRTYQLLGYLNTRPRTTYMMRVRNPNPDIRVYDEHDPLSHGSHGAGHGDGHGSGHGDDHGDHHDDHGGSHDNGSHDTHEGEAHSSATSYLDSMKQYTDQGYALSLKVLGAHA